VPFTRGFVYPADRARHYARHGGDFGATNEMEYEEQADIFLGAPKSITSLESIRGNGDRVRYDPATEEFGVLAKNGRIKSYFRPDPAVHGLKTNLHYFWRQS